MEKKKILYMNMTWISGGIEAYMWNVFEHIDYERYDIDLVLPGEIKWPIEETLADKGIRVIHYPVNSIGQQIKEIKKVLSMGDYDIVHVMQNYLSWETHTVFSLVALAEQKHHHYKVICHSHGAEDKTRTVTFLRKMIRNVFRSVLRWAFSHADLLAACSAESGEFVYGHRKNVEIFYNGIDIDKFRAASSSYSIPQWHKKYGIDEKKLNFVVVARMANEKNPLFILDVIHALSGHYPEINLIWVGTGEMKRDIEAYIEKLGMADRVQLLGVQDHVEEILACCDYFILPSKYEGLGIAFIEAQAAGLRCFASDRVPQAADCGGMTFIPLDKAVDQWANEIHRQIEERSKVNIDMERLDRFDVSRTVKELSEVYDRLVES